MSHDLDVEDCPAALTFSDRIDPSRCPPDFLRAFGRFLTPASEDKEVLESSAVETQQPVLEAAVLKPPDIVVNCKNDSAHKVDDDPILETLEEQEALGVNWFEVQDLFLLSPLQRLAHWRRRVDQYLQADLESKEAEDCDPLHELQEESFRYWMQEIVATQLPAVNQLVNRQELFAAMPRLEPAWREFFSHRSMHWLLWAELPIKAGFPDFSLVDWDNLSPADSAYWDRYLAYVFWRLKLPHTGLFPPQTDPDNLSAEQLAFRCANVAKTGMDRCILEFLDFTYEFYENGKPHTTNYAFSRAIETGPHSRQRQLVKTKEKLDREGKVELQRYYEWKDWKGVSLGDALTKVPGSTLGLYRRLGMENERRWGKPVVTMPNGPPGQPPNQARDRTLYIADHVSTVGRPERFGGGTKGSIAKMMSKVKSKDPDKSAPVDLPYLSFLLDLYLLAGLETVLIVEGESDSQTVLFNAPNIAVLGIPGAARFRLLANEHLEQFSTIWVWEEPDDAGEAFSASVADWINRPVKVLRPCNLPASLLVVAKKIKDVCELGKFLAEHGAMRQLELALHYLAEHENNEVRPRIGSTVRLRIGSTVRPRIGSTLKLKPPKKDTRPMQLTAAVMEAAADLYYGYALAGASAEEGQEHPCLMRLENMHLPGGRCVAGACHGSENQFLRTGGYGYDRVTCFTHRDLVRLLPVPHELTVQFYEPEIHGEPFERPTAGELPRRLEQVERELRLLIPNAEDNLVVIHEAERFQFDLDIDTNYSTVLISGPPGCGKTELLLRKALSVPSALYVVPRRSAVADIGQRAKRLVGEGEESFRSHLQVEADQLASQKYLILCPESLYRLRELVTGKWLKNPPHILVLDEWTDICRLFDSQTMVLHLEETIDIITGLFEICPQVFIICADLDTRGLNLLAGRLRQAGKCLLLTLRRPVADDPCRRALDLPRLEPRHPVQRYLAGRQPLGAMPPIRRTREPNAFAIEPRSYVLVQSSTILKQMLAVSLEAGDACVVFCAHRKQCEALALELAERYPGMVGLAEEADEPEGEGALATSARPGTTRFLARNPENWLRFRIVLYTGVFGAGVSICLSPPHFSAMFAFLAAFGSSPLPLQIQSMERVRHFARPVVYMAVRKSYRPDLLRDLLENVAKLRDMNALIRPSIEALRIEQLRTKHDPIGELVRRMAEKDEAVYELKWPLVSRPPGRPRKTAADVERLPIGLDRLVLAAERICDLEAGRIEARARRDQHSNAERNRLVQYRLRKLGLWDAAVHLRPCSCCDQVPPSEAQPNVTPASATLSLEFLKLFEENRSRLLRLALCLVPEYRGNFVSAMNTGEFGLVEQARLISELLRGIGLDLRLCVREVGPMQLPETLDARLLRVCSSMPEHFRRLGLPVITEEMDEQAVALVLRELLSMLGLRTEEQADGLLQVDRERWELLLYLANSQNIMAALGAK